jgi:hypothetical protein
MADVQGLFETFHSQIRTSYEINDQLREKKDIIVERVKNHLGKMERPSCAELIQGSYKMSVGVLPVDGSEYDIDVGLRFSFDESSHSAEEVRSWVFDAVDGHTQQVDEKAPCIRVTYSDGYHVDLVCYCRWEDANGTEHYRLARRSTGWRPADPQGLVDFVIDWRKPFEGTEDSKTKTDQFRRAVRYLKRWNDLRMPGESDNKPSGLALILLTRESLTHPCVTWDGVPDDCLALELVASAAGSRLGRISASKPTPEFEEMFSRISDKAMQDLKANFRTLADALAEARNAKDAEAACKILRREFGPDFPCPDGDGGSRASVHRTAAPAVVPSTSSALHRQ